MCSNALLIFQTSANKHRMLFIQYLTSRYLVVVYDELLVSGRDIVRESDM